MAIFRIGLYAPTGDYEVGRLANPGTNYKSGTQMHLDGTLVQHVPMLRSTTGFGITDFWYKRLTDDSGEGANIGGFRARANGIGPVVSYIRKSGQEELATSLKWLHEFDNRNRPGGDTLFLKLMWNFGS